MNMDTMSYFVHRILFLGAVLCVTASARLIADYNWPVPDRHIDKFPHESSCHYYYLMLSEEDITVEKCPDGQLFDYVKHSCISDNENIHCWSRHFGKMKHDHLHMKHKKHFKCPYPWGKYPNLHDCSKYHLCLNNKSRVKKCAHYELFDKVSRKCVAAIDAVCADKTDVVEDGYVCPKTWGSFTNSKDCSKYYECLQRKPTLRTCQKGKLFDDRLRKCAPSEKVYCGLRHNPYEKLSSAAPSTTILQKSTALNQQESSTTVEEVTSTPQKASSTTKVVASTSTETSSTTKIATSISPEASSTIKVAISTSPDSSSTTKKVTLIPPEASSTIKEVTSTSPEASSTIKEVTSTSPEASSTIKEVTSTSPEASSTIKKITSSSPAASSTIKKVTSTNQPTKELSSAAPEADNKESKQEAVISTLDPNAIVKSENQQKPNDLIKTLSTQNEIVATTEIASDEEPEEEKKDVSTEEKETDVSKSKNKPEGNTDSSITTGCLPEDSMCTTEKDGTVVKCSNSKDLQPHPKDEKRFLDCTEDKIQIYTCPQGLTFRPDTKMCKWQFIMG